MERDVSHDPKIIPIFRAGGTGGLFLFVVAQVLATGLCMRTRVFFSRVRMRIAWKMLRTNPPDADF